MNDVRSRLLGAKRVNGRKRGRSWLKEVYLTEGDPGREEEEEAADYLIRGGIMQRYICL